MHEMSVCLEELSRRIAQQLFTSRSGHQAERLVLMDQFNNELGGWCEHAVVGHIHDALEFHLVKQAAGATYGDRRGTTGG